MKRVLMTGGMGDHAAGSGMVCDLAYRHGGIALPVLKRYMHSVHQIYRRHEEVELEPYESFEHILKLKEDKNSIVAFAEQIPEDIGIDQFQHMYSLAGVDYIERWASCPIPAASKFVHPQHMADKPFSLVHASPERQLHIDPSRLNQSKRLRQIYVNEFSTGLLSWRWMIENASEIEAIPSSIFVLAEQLNLQPSVKLRLHRYARPYYPVWCDYETRYDWEILK